VNAASPIEPKERAGFFIWKLSRRPTVASNRQLASPSENPNRKSVADAATAEHAQPHAEGFQPIARQSERRALGCNSASQEIDMTAELKPIPMNEYDCWISGQRSDTEEIIVAASSFEARKVIAHKYRLPITDTASHRRR
jgi:hypothetical protein